MRKLREYEEDVRKKIIKIKNEGKVEMIGEKEEEIYMELYKRKVEEIGIEKKEIMKELKDKNEIKN